MAADVAREFLAVLMGLAQVKALLSMSATTLAGGMALSPGRSVLVRFV